MSNDPVVEAAEAGITEALDGHGFNGSLAEAAVAYIRKAGFAIVPSKPTEAMTQATWPRELFVHEDADVGVKISQFATSIQTYVMMQQGRQVSVRELIDVFNTDRQSVLDAIEDGCWLGSTGPDDDDTKRFVWVDGE